jgi:hypothetical protein
MKGLAQRWGGPFAFRDYKMAQGIEYTPTDKDRHAVEMMAAAGITQEGIARVLEICVDTLAKYYRTELDTSFGTLPMRAIEATLGPKGQRSSGSTTDR